MNYYIAQANIAVMRASADAPIMQGLVTRIDEMNKLAEQSKGFVWRLKDSEITHEARRACAEYCACEPDRLFYNMSVWESIEDLKNYAFKSQHSEMLRGKQNWLEQFERAHLALWWIPSRCLPTIEDSLARLRAISDRGPTDYAFTFRTPFAKPVS